MVFDKVRLFEYSNGVKVQGLGSKAECMASRMRQLPGSGCEGIYHRVTEHTEEEGPHAEDAELRRERKHPLRAICSLLATIY